MKYMMMMLVLVIALVACGGDDPTPIMVPITATPDEAADQNVSVNRFPGPTPTRSNVTITPSPTATATATVALPTNTPPPLPDVPPADQLPVLNQSRMGIQLHPLVEEEVWYQLLDLVDRLGFDWIKIQVPWDELQPARGQYSDLFQTYVQRVQWANFVGNRQRKVLLSIVNAPDWARPAGFDPAQEGPPANAADIVPFLQDFITATDPSAQRIAAIEVWNEPNLEREWNGVPMDGGTYMSYFATIYDAIKSVDPSITIVTAGLAPVGDGVPGTVGDRTFLRQMYAAGLANYPDVKIGVHPYGWANSPDERCCTDVRGWADNPVFFFQDTIYDYWDIIQTSGHSTRIWITEFGWGTYEGVGVDGNNVEALPQGAEFFALISQRQQAEYTIRAFELLHQPPLGDIVEREFLWNLNFAALPFVVDRMQEQAGYSLLNASGQPRLTYYYLASSRRIP